MLTSPGVMRVAFVAVSIVASLVAPAGALAQGTPEQRADALVAKMTNDQKLDLIGPGKGTASLGIPSLVAWDGPNGVGHGNKGVTAFPDAVDIGASWDPELARSYGAALGEELRAIGGNVLLGPTVNIVRNPRWGRAAETLGEDPFLTSSLVVPEIEGVQSAGVVAEVKHYAGNNQEYGRVGNPLLGPGVDVHAAERTLREIYYPAFRAAALAGVGSAMCSYNKINGTESCQNPASLGALKADLKGFVEPDALVAVRDPIAAFKAGVDQFSLGSLVSAATGNAGTPERDLIQAALLSGQVSQQRVDDATHRILTALIQAGLVGKAPAQRTTPSTPAHRSLATRISTEATTLLRDQHHVLPLTRRVRSIAVIGYDAGKGTDTEEGGSPAVPPGAQVIDPLAGIRRRAPHGTRITYRPGTAGVVPLPITPSTVLTPPSGSGHGLTGTYYATTDYSGAPVMTRTDPTVDFKSSAGPLQQIPGTGASSAKWTGTLTAPTSGTYRFSLTFSGHGTLKIAGKTIIDGDTEAVNWRDLGFPGAPDTSFHAHVPLRAGKPAPIEIDYSTNASTGGAVMHFGWQTSSAQKSLRATAVAAARRADVAVVFANDVTAEGMDRTTLALPGDQDALISAVAKANRHTIVVLHTSGAVLMPWHDKVAGILEAWYPGQQSGAAIARTLFGDVDPSGRLPVTFPASDAQGPTPGSPFHYPVVDYDEGLLVGYRWYETKHQRPLFPFGYGLSYTSFKLGRANVVKTAAGGISVSVPVTNTGRRTGAQVVQVYVDDPAAAGEPRQLKGFARVTLPPGKTRTARITIARSSLEIWDTASDRYAVPTGTYGVAVGTSAAALQAPRSIRLG